MSFGIIQMQARNLRRQIDNVYNQGGAYPWVRELIVNSVQANATDIYFGIEWNAVRAGDVYRRTAVDNGEGMSLEHLGEFINTFGGSGNYLVSNGSNFGYGAKVSLLPWNTEGLIFISKTEDGSLSMVWMAEEDGEYGARTFYDDDTEDYVGYIDLSDGRPFFVDEVNAEGENFQVDYAKVANDLLGGHTSGTAVIMVGSQTKIKDGSVERNFDTILGDPSRNESNKYGIAQVISNHFYSIENPSGHPVSISTSYFENHSGGKEVWPKNFDDMRKKNSAPILMKSIMESPVHLSKKTREDGTKREPVSGRIKVTSPSTGLDAYVHWYYIHKDDISEAHIKDDRITTGSGDRTGYPITGVLFPFHRGIMEVFDLEAVGVAGAGSRDLRGDESRVAGFRESTARMSGIIRTKNTRSRVAFLFEPIEDRENGVMVQSANSARSGLAVLTRDGSHPLPWGEWTSDLRAKLPNVIEKSIRDDYSSSAKGDVKLNGNLINSLRDRYLPMFKSSVFAAYIDPKGKSKGTRTGRREKPTGAPGGVTTGAGTGAGAETKENAEVNPNGNESVTEKNTSSGLVSAQISDAEKHVHLISYIERDRVANINSTSGDYKRIQEFVLGEAVKAGRISTDDEDEPLRAALTDIVDEALVTLAICAVTDIVSHRASLKKLNRALSREEKETLLIPDDAEANKLLEPLYLSNALRGLRPVYEECWGKVTSTFPIKVR